jgi:hypothetical protein
MGRVVSGPTLIEIARHHWNTANFNRGVATTLPAEEARDSRIMRERAAWHEAAARQVEAMAGQEVRLREAVRDVIELANEGVVDTCSETALTILKAALAAPSAEEPRAGASGWVEAYQLPDELEGTRAWRWDAWSKQMDITFIPRGYDRRVRACWGVWFYPLPQPDPPPHNE